MKDGRPYVDIRTFWTPDGGESWRPSQKGITLSPQFAGTLIELLQRAGEEGSR